MMHLIIDLTNTSIKIIQSYYQTNLFAINTFNTENSPSSHLEIKKEKKSHILTLFNMNTNKKYSEFIFHNKIRNVLITKSNLVVIFKTKAYIYDLFSYENIDVFNTYQNPNGIFAITQSEQSHNIIVAYPDEAKGFVRIKDYRTSSTMLVFIDETGISALDLTQNLLAVAALDGVNIKIIAVSTGEVVQLLKRGIGDAYVNQVLFDNKGVMLAATSSKGTVHIWSINQINNRESVQDTIVDNISSNVFGRIVKKNNMTILNKIFFGKISKEEKSFAQMHLNESMSICAFSENSEKLYVIGISGTLYIGVIDFVDGGEIRIEKKEDIKQLQIPKRNK